MFSFSREQSQRDSEPKGDVAADEEQLIVELDAQQFVELEPEPESVLQVSQ